MSKQDGFHVGFWSSFTIQFYILIILLAVLFIGGGYFFLWHTNEDQEKTAATETPSSVRREVRKPADEMPDPSNAAIQDVDSNEGVQILREEDVIAEIESIRSSAMIEVKEQQVAIESKAKEQPQTHGVQPVPEAEVASGESSVSGTAMEPERKPQGEEETVVVQKQETTQGSWVVQLSVNKNPEFAQSWAEKVSREQVKGYIVESSSRTGAPLYKVRMGFFPTEAEARARAEAVTQKLGLSGYIVTKAGKDDLAQAGR